MAASSSAGETLGSDPPAANRFLDALPEGVRDALREAGEIVELPLGEVVAYRDERVGFVHFPYCGAISEIEDQFDGGSAEVTVVGPEGLSPIEVLLESAVEQRRRLVQVASRALAVPPDVVTALAARSPELRSLGNRYAVATLRVAGIGLACNARHAAPARLARWLLRMRDRVGNDRFDVTHEATAMMLAVRRPTVTLAINELVLAGAIESTRGAVRILDRPMLEALTCQCYVEARDAVDRLYA